MESEPVVEFERAEVLYFDTIEALDALVTPFRIRLMTCFRQPGTIKDAATRLGVGTTRLYHHVHKLVGHGFLVEVGERPAGKTTERIYSVAARVIRPSPEFLERYGGEGNAELLRLLFRSVEAEVVAAAEADPALNPEDERTAVSYTRLHLDEAVIPQLVKEVEGIAAKYRPFEGDVEVGLFGVVMPLANE